ncbi:hypothetical protein PSI23_06360 [Xenorhabdus sp. XENO-10]|uniref:Uncharacterized protein n=2 Tax=Xenorhabdus TaxID=626 RepID=A0ABT5LEG2_9GAMM|nr:hypothetical protein [Xenorhabdus yunnanensis]MDC9588948.1 hypothetical protein [Xenorhabdus yunnanensis]
MVRYAHGFAESEMVFALPDSIPLLYRRINSSVSIGFLMPPYMPLRAFTNKVLIRCHMNFFEELKASFNESIEIKKSNKTALRMIRYELFTENKMTLSAPEKPASSQRCGGRLFNAR